MKQFKNGGTVYNVLAREGRYALLQRIGKFPEIVIACGIHGEDNGDWEQGRYFGDNLKDATTIYESYVGGNMTAYVDFYENQQMPL